MGGMKRVVVGDESQTEFNVNNNDNVNYKVIMTSDQVEVLRKQICAYVTICNDLLHLHRSQLTYQFPGMRLGNMYCDPTMTSSGHKISTRQRWTPTSTQLQILESIFSQGNGSPGKQRVKELTNELSQHGPISETNVYNWFQNRRARLKRKKPAGVPNPAESEAEGEIESPKEKKSKVEHFGTDDKLATRGENVTVQSPEISDNAYCFDSQLTKGESVFDIDCSLTFSEGFDDVALFESDPRMHYLLDKMEFPEGFSHQLDEEFNTSG